MSKFFILLAVLLIFTGALLLAVPRDVMPAATRGSTAPQAVSLLSTARTYAEAVNAPLSILFGLVSLFYSRRTYLAQSSHGNGAANVSQRT